VNVHRQWFAELATAGKGDGNLATSETALPVQRQIDIEAGVPTFLYRLYDATGNLLYVGITSDIARRMNQHATDKAWWPEVARKTIELHPSRSDAGFAEMAAVRKEHPRHNVRGRRDPDGSKAGGHDCIADQMWDFMIDILYAISTATPAQVASWHQRMTQEGAATLGQIFQTGADFERLVHPQDAA